MTMEDSAFAKILGYSEAIPGAQPALHQTQPVVSNDEDWAALLSPAAPSQPVPALPARLEDEDADEDIPLEPAHLALLEALDPSAVLEQDEEVILFECDERSMSPRQQLPVAPSSARYIRGIARHVLHELDAEKETSQSFFAHEYIRFAAMLEPSGNPSATALALVELLRHGASFDELELAAELRALWDDFASDLARLTWRVALRLVRRFGGLPCLEQVEALLLAIEALWHDDRWIAPAHRGHDHSIELPSRYFFTYVNHILDQIPAHLDPLCGVELLHDTLCAIPPRRVFPASRRPDELHSGMLNELTALMDQYPYRIYLF